MIPSYQKEIFTDKEVFFMVKGFTTAGGFMGFVDGVYILFASETDYWDYMEN